MGKKFSGKTTHEKSLIWLSKRCSERRVLPHSGASLFIGPLFWMLGRLFCGLARLFLFSSNNVVIKTAVFGWIHSCYLQCLLLNLTISSLFFARPIVVLFWDWVNPIKFVSVVISLLKIPVFFKQSLRFSQLLTNTPIMFPNIPNGQRRRHWRNQSEYVWLLRKLARVPANQPLGIRHH